MARPLEVTAHRDVASLADAKAPARSTTVLDTSTVAGANASRRLGSEYMIWLTTMRQDGQPQPSGVWFHWDGRDFLIFSEPQAPKVHNIRHQANVALNLDGDGTGGGLVIVSGTARILPGQPDPGRLAAYRTKYAHLSPNNLGIRVDQMMARFNTAIVVTPTQYLAHGVSSGGPGNDLDG